MSITPLESLVATGTKLWLDSVDPDEVGLADFGQYPLLVGDVRLYRVGNKEIGTSTGSLRQLRQSLPYVRFQPDTERNALSVCHKHILTQAVTKHSPNG